MVGMRMKGSSVEIALRFVDIIKKLGHVRNEDHKKALESGLVELFPLVDLSGTHDMLAVYDSAGLTVGPNSEKIEHVLESIPVRMYSDEDKIYVLLTPGNGSPVAALYLNRS